MSNVRCPCVSLPRGAAGGSDEQLQVVGEAFILFPASAGFARRTPVLWIYVSLTSQLAARILCSSPISERHFRAASSRSLPGNVRSQSLTELYRHSPLFTALCDISNLEDKCRVCEFCEICGGSRARAYALTGDRFAEETCCIWQQKPRSAVTAQIGVEWSIRTRRIG